MLNSLKVLYRTNPTNDQVRNLLVATLYAQPASLVLGALCGSLAALPAVLGTDNIAIAIIAVTQAVIGLMRVATTHIARNTVSASRQQEKLFELLAYAYALCSGVIASMAVAYNIEPAARTLCVTFTCTYAAGLAARNAGRPTIVIGQISLTMAPIIGTAALAPGLANKLLAVCCSLFFLAILSITHNLFRVLRESIAAAETSHRLAEKMQHVARTDIVTGLLSRAGLTFTLVEKLTDLPQDRQMALLWLDLDRFKEVNDTLGHKIGDRVLAETAARLRRRAPRDACIARFGGDEFILAFETANLEAASKLADGILLDLTRAMRIDDDRIEIGCSMGLAIYPTDGKDLDEVMQAADLALHHAKQGGRGQITHFNKAMTLNLIRRKEMEADLRRALQRGELTVFYQPIIDLHSGRIHAFEALVRWFHSEKGELRPDEFIPLAEETGAIITLGNWITATAAKAAAQWPEDIMLAVNLSPLQIRAQGASLAILTAVRDARLAPERLFLEITETALLDHGPTTASFINELQQAGVQFALDDFGTGYSSLGYIDKYPFSKIKIDRSFVAGIHESCTSQAVIRAVADIGGALGMDIVAEGLETLEQVQAVRAAGCRLGQGWYFGKAVPDYLATMLIEQDQQRFAAHHSWQNHSLDEDFPALPRASLRA